MTSPTGQAIRDLLRNLLRRFPRSHVTLRPARVQGDGAAADIAQGIRDLDEVGGVDVVIVGRGGGSREDLAAFNDEALARAIAACSVPVVSAVGHEGDVSVADLVADERVSTPTAAAEVAVPVLRELLDDLLILSTRLVEALRGRVDRGRERVRALEQRHALRRPVDRVHELSQRVDELRGRLDAGVRTLVGRRRETLGRVAAHVEGVSPLGVLARGYSVTTREGSPAPLQDPRDVRAGDVLTTRLAGGSVRSVVEGEMSGD